MDDNGNGNGNDRNSYVFYFNLKRMCRINVHFKLKHRKD